MPKLRDSRRNSVDDKLEAEYLERARIWFASFKGLLEQKGFDLNNPLDSTRLKEISIKRSETDFGAYTETTNMALDNTYGIDEYNANTFLNDASSINLLDDHQIVRLYRQAEQGQLLLMPDDGNNNGACGIFVTENFSAGISAPISAIGLIEDMVDEFNETASPEGKAQKGLSSGCKEHLEDCYTEKRRNASGNARQWFEAEDRWGSSCIGRKEEWRRTSSAGSGLVCSLRTYKCCLKLQQVKRV